MNHWIAMTVVLLGACGEARSTPNEPAEALPEVPVAEPEPEAEPWLRELLGFDLQPMATDARTVELGENLESPVTCPRPGTGCYVELELAGQTTQVHVGDDHVLQIWGPTEPFQMPGWVTGVEEDIDRSPLTALNEPGTRPDRLWRDGQHIVLLHDHSGLPCAGFCPSMIWIARPGHPAAAGYGFPTADP